MNRIKFTWLIIVLLMSKMAGAQIYGYKNKSYSSYDYQTGKYVTAYNKVKLNEISLKKTSIQVQPHGSYLEVIENSVISLQVSTSDAEENIWIEGTLGLPPKSSIVSLYFANDSGAYKAQVQPAYKAGNPVDTTLGNALVTLSRLEIDNYILKIFSVLPGKEYHVILRYYVPNTGSAVPSYDLGVIFNSHHSRPGILEFSYLPDSSQRHFTIYANNTTLQLNKNQSLQIPYQESFRLYATDHIETSMHTTSIDTGAWSGKYLLLNTTIPDSVISKLSKKIEVVVLWRWNRPSTFVMKDSLSGERSITNYGQQAITQAQAIRLLVQEIAKSGNRSGLVHSIQYHTPLEVFQLCKINSSAYAKLDTYLGQYSKDYFLNSGYFPYDTKPEKPGDTILAPDDSARSEFLKSLNLVHGLYSNGSGILKHLVIVSCGPVQESRNIVTLEEIDTLLSGVTVDCNNSVWRNVNFNLVEHAALHEKLVPFGDFLLPEFKPNSYILEVSSEKKTYSFPIPNTQSSFSIIAKSDSLWNSDVSWKGLNVSGSSLGTVLTKSTVYDFKSDTGLVKLWAENNERLTETNEKNIELKYGIISEKTCMKIFPSFKGYDSTATAYASIYDKFCPDTEKISGIGPGSLEKFSRFICFSNRECLKIALPNHEQIRKIQIYLLTGKLIAEFDPQKFKSKDGYTIPLSILSEMSKKNVVVLRIVGTKTVINQKIMF